MRTILALPEKKARTKSLPSCRRTIPFQQPAESGNFTFPQFFTAQNGWTFSQIPPARGHAWAGFVEAEFSYHLAGGRAKALFIFWLCLGPNRSEIFEGCGHTKPSCLVSQNRKPFGWLIGKLVVVVVLVISNCEACWIGILWLIWEIHWQTMPKAV